MIHMQTQTSKVTGPGRTSSTSSSIPIPILLVVLLVLRTVVTHTKARLSDVPR